MILSLALGIGLNAGVYSILDWVLLRGLPYPSPQQLVRVFTAAVAPATGPRAVTADEFSRFGRAESFVSAAAFATATRVLASTGTSPVHVVVARVEGDLRATLGAPLAAGRSFRPEEIAAGAPVLVLSHGLWRRQFHEDTTIVGRAVIIDGVAHTVVGVMAAGREYPRDADVWRPLTARERASDDRELSMVARLRDGATIERANAELATVASGLPAPTRSAWAVDLQRTETGGVRTTLNALLASTLLVLVLVCANVATLIGVNTSDRAGELAVRGALGATRMRLAAQLTIETMILAAAGGAVGLLFGRWAVRLLTAMAPVGLPRLSEIQLDGRVLGIGTVATVVIGLAVGLVPALRLSRTRGGTGLHQELGNRSTRRSGVRPPLVAAQVAMAVLLTIGAGLLGRSLENLVAVDNGFAVDNLIAVDLYLRGSNVNARQLFHDLIDSAEALPGVHAAAVGMQMPTQVAGLRTQVQIVGESSAPAPATLRPVTPRYFEVLGVPVTAGRAFSGLDTATFPTVAIVNARFVRDVLGGRSPIGLRLTASLVKGPVSVVGLVSDITPAGEPERPALYVPVDQLSVGGGFLIVRTQGDARSVLPTLTARVQSVAPALAVDRVRRVSEVLEQSRALTRFETQLAITFAGLALLVSAVGVYGLTSSEVTARWRELAVRRALGASTGRTLWIVARPCAVAIAAGLVIGLVGALMLTPSFASLLHGVSPTDLATFCAAPAVLVAVGVAAVGIASRRVLSAELAATLRGD